VSRKRRARANLLSNLNFIPRLLSAKERRDAERDQDNKRTQGNQPEPAAGFCLEKIERHSMSARAQLYLNHAKIRRALDWNLLTVNRGSPSWEVEGADQQLIVFLKRGSHNPALRLPLLDYDFTVLIAAKSSLRNFGG
jgi:hypothetical protein